jgi:hypothetical protein
VTGTLAGKPVAATDTFADSTTFKPAGSPAHDITAISIVDYAGACAIAEANQQKAGSNLLTFVFDLSNMNQPTSPPPLPPAVYAYDVNTSPTTTTPDASGNVIQIEVYYDSLDTTCHLPSGNLFATKGTITLTSVTASSIVGSFDLSFPNNDHLTGMFSSPICNPPSSGPPTCQ